MKKCPKSKSLNYDYDCDYDFRNMFFDELDRRTVSKKIFSEFGEEKCGRDGGRDGGMEGWMDEKSFWSLYN